MTSNYGRTSPFRSVDALAEYARNLGFEVVAADLPDEDGSYVLDITGHGEVIEAYFQESPETGFMRFDYAFIHDNAGGGDRLNSSARLRSDLNAIWNHREEH